MTKKQLVAVCALFAVFCSGIVLKEASSAASAFRSIKFPHGITMSIPVNWRGLPKNVATQANETAEAVVDLSGINLNLDGYTQLLLIS